MLGTRLNILLHPRSLVIAAMCLAYTASVAYVIETMFQ